MVSSYPSFWNLSYLVLQAIIQVVIVCIPGYLLNQRGVLSSSTQKTFSDINIQVFTPCLVFIKLASQLTTDKLAGLAIIPVIFVFQTLIAWSGALLLSRFFGFNQKQKNFVIAVSVFGNSNSLPMSLVMSLSKTIVSLRWLDQFPNDKAADVAARGILYLVIFQQLGLVLRWTWGSSVLLAPDDDSKPLQNNGRNELYDDNESYDERSPLVSSLNDDTDNTPWDENYLAPRPAGMAISSNSSSATLCGQGQDDDENSPFFRIIGRTDSSGQSTRVQRLLYSAKGVARDIYLIGGKWIYSCVNWTVCGVLGVMSPPLWAILCALCVSTIPFLHSVFFTPGTFFANSITPAITQLSRVSVPLTLVVLGANISNKPEDDKLKLGSILLPGLPEDSVAAAKLERNLITASIIGRMVIPPLASIPLLILALIYVPVKILEDPIFVVVCFLLLGAPTALQLAQICQRNDVYVNTMSRVLVQGYLVWILPSTLMLVYLAVLTLKWAV